MFDMDETNNDVESVNKHKSKKRKFCEPIELHSSLSHHSLRVPPMVEYTNIDNYCENSNLTLLCLNNLAEGSTSSSGRNDLMRVSSPIVLKTPKAKVKRTLNSNLEAPYCFFTIEELSLVSSLTNWASAKVCAVGRIIYQRETQEYYLQSVMETGSWRLMLDYSLLATVPVPGTTLQCFGEIILESFSRLKVNFFRYLKSVDLNLFVESYITMQKYIPNFIRSTSRQVHEENKANSEDQFNCLKPPENDSDEFTVTLNDTLDDYDFSEIM